MGTCYRYNKKKYDQCHDDKSNKSLTEKINE